MQFAPSPCVIFCLRALADTCFALGTVKSPVFSLAHDRYHLIKNKSRRKVLMLFLPRITIKHSRKPHLRFLNRYSGGSYAEAAELHHPQNIPAKKTDFFD